MYLRDGSNRELSASECFPLCPEPGHRVMMSALRICARLRHSAFTSGCRLACGQKRADVRPNISWNARGPIGGMAYRIIADAQAPVATGRRHSLVTFRGSGIPSGNSCLASCDFAANIAAPRCRRPTVYGKNAVRLECTPVAPAACPYGPELVTMTLRSVTR